MQDLTATQKTNWYRQWSALLAISIYNYINNKGKNIYTMLVMRPKCPMNSSVAMRRCLQQTINSDTKHNIRQQQEVTNSWDYVQ